MKKKFKKHSPIILYLVLTRRVKVANDLKSKSDVELLKAGRLYLSKMATNPYFSAPTPPLANVATALAAFDALIIAANGGEKKQTSLKNAKREEVINLLSDLSLYVEVTANDPVNSVVGAAAVIESAGMKPKTFSPRQKRGWSVKRGEMPGTLALTAEYVPRGMHEWEYTLTPSNPMSWIDAMPTIKASTIISGLTSGSIVYCRHRSVSKSGVSAWEGHDPVVVG